MNINWELLGRVLAAKHELLINGMKESKANVPLDLARYKRAKSTERTLTIRRNGAWSFSAAVARELRALDTGTVVILKPYLTRDGVTFERVNEGATFSRQHGYDLSWNNKNQARDVAVALGVELPIRMSCIVTETEIICKIK